MTALADSENAIIRHAELVSASRSKNRCALKNEDPMSAEGFEDPRKSVFESSLRSREDKCKNRD